MNQLGRKGFSIPMAWFLSSVLLASLFCAGCKTPPCSEQSFAKPFDAQRVAQLSHDTYKVAWEARHCARQDLRTVSRNSVLLGSDARHGGLAGEATVLDWEGVRYIERLIRQAHWIAYDVERNPASPRCSSKASYDIVAFDARMLKARYRPNLYATYTDALIQKLIELTDEISSYYQLKTPEELPSQK
jgi:hypothetical protein